MEMSGAMWVMAGVMMMVMVGGMVALVWTTLRDRLRGRPHQIDEENPDEGHAPSELREDE